MNELEAELLESLIDVELWLTGALECKEWMWDWDQREAATQARDVARATITKARALAPAMSV